MFGRDGNLENAMPFVQKTIVFVPQDRRISKLDSTITQCQDIFYSCVPN